MKYQQPYKKAFGQHFLVDLGYRERVIRACSLREGAAYVEIGPGSGLLTEALLASDGDVLAVEVDRDCVAYLQQRFAHVSRFRVLLADILSCAPGSFGEQRRRFIGNLPYNISTPLLLMLVEWIPWLEDAVFMLQREVALRVTAEVGTKAYGRLSVMMQRYFQCSLLFDVPPSAFDPPPLVDSSVVALRPHSNALSSDKSEKSMFAYVLQRSFSKRRKMMRCIWRTMTMDDWHVCGVAPNARAEELTVDDFERLTAIVATKESI
mgnify:CR=1 FL=1|tara:strand:+ start:438 stop:1229 length:792 start_codon:yes stop_codon:yes gene_type:complete